MEIILAMKTIFPKCIIHSMSYFLFLSFLLTGYIKNAVIIGSILFIHEMGHVFFLKCFSYEIEKIEFFPFGGMTTTKNKYINSPINKDILIYLGGVLFQIIFYFLVFLWYKKGSCSLYTYQLFILYNKSIFLFNLLPIKTLDGGEIMHLILEKYFPYEKAYRYANNLSILFLILFVIFTIKSSLNSHIVVVFLFYKLLHFIKKKPIYVNKFLVERYMHTFPFKKIEHNEKQDIKYLKKETLHFFKAENKYLHEQEILKRKFDIHSYF